MSEEKTEPVERVEQQGEVSHFTRRDVLKVVSSLGLTSVGGGAAWAALEAGLIDGRATSWHKSVCRYCGTGCGVQVGMREGKVAEVRGDEDAHNRGKLCIKGSLLPALNLLPGRLTQPQIRKAGKLEPASWEEAMSLV